MRIYRFVSDFLHTTHQVNVASILDRYIQWRRQIKRYWLWTGRYFWMFWDISSFNKTFAGKKKIRFFLLFSLLSFMLLYVILLFKSVLLSAYEIWITDCIDQNFAGLVHEFRIFLFFFSDNSHLVSNANLANTNCICIMWQLTEFT